MPPPYGHMTLGRHRHSPPTQTLGAVKAPDEHRTLQQAHEEQDQSVREDPTSQSLFCRGCVPETQSTLLRLNPPQVPRASCRLVASAPLADPMLPSEQARRHAPKCGGVNASLEDAALKSPPLGARVPSDHDATCRVGPASP